MKKLQMQTANKVDENVERIATIFPNCVTESVDKDGNLIRVVDFDLLRQELSGVAVEGHDERYQFTWADKKKSILLANSPISKTLRPCREESVDFDTTKNLYIEGDNLDVLKLLQETYMGKVKMIYIDPPYNTGNDFVYDDDFAISADEYLERSGASDDDGNRLFQNNDSNGRFHTDWLNMIYPRLKLARDLLTDDGIIFISIDDNEQANLFKACDEIFGTRNRLGIIKILSNPRGRQSSAFFAEAGEYVIAYSKQAQETTIIGEDLDEFAINSYNKIDKNGKKFREMGLRKRGSDSRRIDSPTMFFPIFYNEKTDAISTDDDDDSVKIIPYLEDGTEGRWRWSKQKVNIDNSQLYCRKVNRNGQLVYDVFQKDYYSEGGTTKHKDFWIEKEINYDRSAEEIRELFKDKLFDYAKPLYLLKKLIKTCVKNNDIILDFFSGSATTAHAVMQLNAGDGGNRKFIMVQLPEETPDNSEAAKAGYKNICEIGKERIRRAGKKIVTDLELCGQERAKQGKILVGAGTSPFDRHAEWKDLITGEIESEGRNAHEPKDYYKYNSSKLDIGFRVLKLDTSNMKSVFYNPNDVQQDLISNFEDNIKDDRTPEDLLFQVMLDMGVDLSSPITVETLGGKKVFTVGTPDTDGSNASLICCFDKDITKETVTAIAGCKPLYAVFRDSSFARDDVMVSFDQIFETYSPTTERRVI